MNEKFGAFLKESLKSRNITQIKFAEMVGVNKSFVNRWAMGYRLPTEEQMTKICAVLGDAARCFAREDNKEMKDLISGEKEKRDLLEMIGGLSELQVHKLNKLLYEMIDEDAKHDSELEEKLLTIEDVDCTAILNANALINDYTNYIHYHSSSKDAIVSLLPSFVDYLLYYKNIRLM